MFLSSERSVIAGILIFQLNLSAIYFFRGYTCSCYPYCQAVCNSVMVHKARVDCMLHVLSDKFYNELTAPYVVIVHCTCLGNNKILTDEITLRSFIVIIKHHITVHNYITCRVHFRRNISGLNLGILLRAVITDECTSLYIWNSY